LPKRRKANRPRPESYAAKRSFYLCQKSLTQPHRRTGVCGLAGVASASAGINRDADNPVSPELLEWVELILGLWEAAIAKLTEKFRKQLGNTPLHCLNIPDDYAFMEPALVQLLQQCVPPFLSR
jgi:predicted protein tyrosine phosphatase